MSLLDQVRARLREAVAEYEAELRPGGAPHEPRTAQDEDADFPPDADFAPEAKLAPGTMRGPTVRPPPLRSALAAAEPEPAAPGARTRRGALIARLRSPHALREAFVVKEILDRPVGLRRTRGPVRG